MSIIDPVATNNATNKGNIMQNAIYDLMRISLKSGKIPKEVPAHYVLYVQQCHRFKKQPVRQNVILLKG